MEEIRGLIFDVKRDCSEDGPGIRTTVFFKGCPLSCVWCHNPEGIAFKPSIAYDPDRCDPDRCGDRPCLAVCPSNVFTLDPGCRKLRVDHSACTRCDLCFPVCVPKALAPVGRWRQAAELVEELLIDRVFFQSTGGGVTFSGGEPTLQMKFLHRLLLQLKKEGVTAGLETCGHFALEKFQEMILPYLDFIYFDLKLIDPDASLEYTGCSNKKIIKNFLCLYQDANIPVIPRIPLVPGITTSPANLRGLGKFLRKHEIAACTLMRYNPSWQDKVIQHGIKAKYHHPTFLLKEQEENCVKHLLSES